MRKYLLIIVSCLAFSVTANFFAEAKSAHVTSGQSTRHAQIQVLGAGCMACVMSLSKKISEMPGVIACKLSSHNPVKAVVIYDSNKLSVNDFTDLIKRRDLTPKLIFDIPESEFSPKVLAQYHSSLLSH